MTEAPHPRSYLPPEAPLPTRGMTIASLRGRRPRAAIVHPRATRRREITGILGFTMAPILGGRAIKHM